MKTLFHLNTNDYCLSIKQKFIELSSQLSPSMTSNVQCTRQCFFSTCCHLVTMPAACSKANVAGVSVIFTHFVKSAVYCDFSFRMFACQANESLLAPRPIRSRSESSNRTLANSLPEYFLPWTFRSVELSFPGTFARGNEYSRELSLPGTFAPILFIPPFIEVMFML